MATLESAIVTKIADIIPAATVVDLSQQRNNDNSAAENTSKTAAFASSAAILVKAKLGDSVDSTDSFAVEIGAILAIMLASSVYSFTLTKEGIEMIRMAKADLESEAKARRQAAVGLKKTVHQSGGTGGLADLDKRYPEQTWDEQ